MAKGLARISGGLFLVLATVSIVFVIGMRTKSRPILGAVRRLNRAVFNPHQMETAGEPDAFASVIRHTGRTTGRTYDTPVGAVSTNGGFVIALPYGSQADWLKNVLASGSATIVNEGQIYTVDRPEVVAIDTVEDAFSSADRLSHRVFGVDQCLKVRRVEKEW